MAGSPISPDEIEWDLIDITPDNDEDLLIQQAVAAIEVVSKTVNFRGCKASVMKVTHIWTSSDKIPQTGLDVLTQHGMDNIMSAPDGWSKKVDKHYGPKK